MEILSHRLTPIVASTSTRLFSAGKPASDAGGAGHMLGVLLRPGTVHGALVQVGDKFGKISDRQRRGAVGKAIGHERHRGVEDVAPRAPADPDGVQPGPGGPAMSSRSPT